MSWMTVRQVPTKTSCPLHDAMQPLKMGKYEDIGDANLE